MLRAEVRADAGRRTVGEVVATLLEAVRQDRQDGLAQVILAMWSEAVRDPALAERLREGIEAMGADLAPLVRIEQDNGLWPGMPAESIVHAMLLELLGFVVQVALRGDRYVADVPDAVRVLWSGTTAT